MRTLKKFVSAKREQIKLLSVLIILIVSLLAANSLFVHSQNFVTQKSEFIDSAQIEVSLQGRDFTAQEREAIEDLASSEFEVRNIQLNVEHEFEGDFRVGTARIAMVDDGFPVNSLISNRDNVKFGANRAWVSPALASELGLQIGDELTVLGKSVIFSNDLVGFPNGVLSSSIEASNMILHKSDFSDLSKELSASNTINKIFVHVVDKSPKQFINELAAKIDVSDLSVKDRNLAMAGRFEKMRSAQLIAEILVVGTIAFIGVVLMAVMAQFKVANPKLQEKTSALIIGKLSLIGIVFVGFVAICIGQLFEFTKLTMAFKISNFHYIAIASIAAIEIFMKSNLRMKIYGLAVEIALIALMIFVQFQLFASLPVACGFGIVMLIILIGMEIIRCLPKNIRETFEPQFFYTVVAILLCSIMTGVLIEGSMRLSANDVQPTAFTAYNLSDASASGLSEILEEEGLNTPVKENVMVAHISTVNGHEMEVMSSNRRPAPLWITSEMSTFNNVKILSGSLWNSMTKEPSIAMTREQANRIGVHIGDKIGLFANGLEAVVELKAIFSMADPTGSPFENVLANNAVQDLIAHTSYVKISADPEVMSDLISKISTKFPEVGIVSNSSENWIQNRIAVSVMKFQSFYETIMGGFVIFLIGITAIRLPMISFAENWSDKPAAMVDNVNRFIPVLFGHAILYAVTMVFVSAAFYFANGLSFGDISTGLRLYTWIAVAAFIAIFAIIMLCFQLRDHHLRG